MTTTTDFERLVGAWLETSGPLDVPAPAVEAALDVARRTPQRRGIQAWLAGGRPWPATAQRGGTRSGALRLAVVVILLAAALALAAIVGSRINPPPPPDPADLRGTWVAENPGVPGLNATGPEVRLVFEGGLGRVRAIVGDIAVVGGARLPSDIDPVDGSELRVTTARDGHGCRAGDVGRYSWSLSPGRALLTLELIEDDCGGRGTLFARTWVRDLAGPSSGGTGVVLAFEPAFMVTLPAGSYTTVGGSSTGLRTPDLVEIYDTPETIRFTAFKNVDGFRDACNIDDRLPLEPGVDALVAYLQQNDVFSAVTTTETTLDGHRAVRVRVTARTTAVCEGDSFALWTPRAVPSPYSVNLGPGDADEIMITEVDGATLLFEVLPGGHPARDQIFDSIRFMDGLPTGP